MLKVLSLATSAIAVGQLMESLHEYDEDFDLDYHSNIILDNVFNGFTPAQDEPPSEKDVSQVLAS